MNKIISLSILLLLVLAGCVGGKGELKRVDFDNYTKNIYKTTTNEKMIKKLTNTFNEVKWDPNTEASMSRKEDVSLTLFYVIDENKPEKIYTYKVWFNEDKTATIISDNDKEGYGKLNIENSNILKKLVNEK